MNFSATKVAGNRQLIYAELLREISGFLPMILVPIWEILSSNLDWPTQTTDPETPTQLDDPELQNQAVVLDSNHLWVVVWTTFPHEPFELLAL